MSHPLQFRLASPEIPLILIPARLNGQGPHHLLIDTGNGEAEPILFRPVATTLGLSVHSEREEPGVLGAVRTARTRLDRLEVGSIRRSAVETILLDELPLPQVMLRPAGILGYGFFREFRLVIDYPRGTLEFAATTTEGARGVAVTLGSPKPYVILEAKVNQAPPRSFLLDTGASSTAIAPALAAELGLSVRQVEAIGVGGATEAGLATVARLEAAGVAATDAEVGVIDLFGPVSQAAGRRIDGILGYSFLRHCRVEIDYPARRLLLARTEPAPS